MGLFRYLYTGKVKESPRPSQEAEFDIEGLDVFSIEREEGTTIIGYIVEKDTVLISAAVQGTNVFPGVIEPVKFMEEWHITTTDEQHRKFCERLAAKIAKREQNNLAK